MVDRVRILGGFVVSPLPAGVLVGLLTASAPVFALDYTEVTPSGPEFPVWDGGDTGLRFADIDADGNVDFLSIGDHGSPYINTNQHGVMVFFGDGGGGWSIHMEGDFGYGGIAVGDVNNDGLLDVGYGMHHDYGSTDFGDQLIEVALGDGTGTQWTPWDDGLATNGETYGMFASDFADIDADGDLDLASNSFGSGNGVHVYRNEGDGTWTQTWSRTGGNAGAQLCFGDVNGDGYPDLAAYYQNGTVFLGDGLGGFTRADDGLPPAGLIGHSGPSLGDVDGDGCADLSFTDDGAVRVYAWRTDHWLSFSSGLPATGDYEISLLRDMDVDGFLDVVAVEGGAFRVWLGDGAGNWTPGGTFTSGPASTVAALDAGGDIDHNGLPDAVLVQREGAWPNDRNELHVIRETTIPLQRFVAVQFPRGEETFHGGSVQTLRWSAAHVGDLPAAIDLEFSSSGPEGPWSSIAAARPDGGHHQWTVPAVATDQAHVRVTLTQAGQSISATSAAFRVLDPGATGALPARIGGGPVRLRLLGNPIRERARFRIEGVTTLAGWRLTVHDASGRVVRRLRPAGPIVTWDLADRSGRSVAAGVYYVVLSRGAGEAGAPRRVVVLR